MEPIRPEDLNLSALPRSPLGHLKADAVAELLQRAAWDYRESLALNQRLAAQVRDLTHRIEELTAQVTSLEEVAARHKDPDELARTLLASAQRAAREERESARREAELLLKKANRRAQQRDGCVTQWLRRCPRFGSAISPIRRQVQTVALTEASRRRSANEHRSTYRGRGFSAPGSPSAIAGPQLRARST